MINYLAVLVCAVLSMVVGSIWYGPLFGKKWAKIIGTADMDPAKCKEMQRKAMPLYVVQFVLTLFQVWVLARAVAGDPQDAPQNMIWIWAAIIVPTLAGSSMWSNDSTEIKWSRFLIQAGYQLIMFVIFGFVLGLWR